MASHYIRQHINHNCAIFTAVCSSVTGL